MSTTQWRHSHAIPQGSVAYGHYKGERMPRSHDGEPTLCIECDRPAYDERGRCKRCADQAWYKAQSVRTEQDCRESRQERLDRITAELTEELANAEMPWHERPEYRRLIRPSRSAR